MEENKVDIKENYIKCLDDELLSILLKDRSSGRNIIWATDIYADRGPQYDSWEPITVKLITGRYGKVIRPRIDKSQREQKIRIKDKAEVFTPSWICNEMANHLSDEWFEKKNVFNIEKEKTWTTSKNIIQFSNEEGKTWQDYIKSKVLEISCGEAPFLVSRYDTTTGEWIDVGDRIGMLDRKLRVVNENCEYEPEWYKWTLEAIKSTYGYEWQGDSLLIARENILFTFIDYYIAKFENFPIKEYLIEVAKILSWNIWQMDGLKYVIPNSCKPIPKRQMSLFDDEDQFEQCDGCTKNDNSLHTGIYCKIINWDTKRTIKFYTMSSRKAYKGEKRMKFDFVIGNPPYQENVENRGEQPPIYHLFYDAAFSVSPKVCLITPGRFLFNVGKTPETWNKKMLNDEHFKVLKYYSNSKNVFSGVDIKGGIAIGYRNEEKDFGAIKRFSQYSILQDIIEKVVGDCHISLNEILYSNTSYKYSEKMKNDHPEFFIKDKNGKSRLSGGSSRYLASSSFDNLSEIFFKTKPNDAKEYIQILGRQNNVRVYYYFRKDYINPPENFYGYKVFLPSSNGSGAIGEVISTPLVGTPLVGATETFISFGNFKDKDEAENCLKYIKTKFCRTMLGTKKVTQGNKNAKTWENVPLQDFTNKSDINWTKSIHEIDIQLYEKYNLTQDEIRFIETHVEEMK